ncbi:MAG: phytanoyl-CoA dioxygenase family protein [Novosphingobium sp.]|nr:phytanoyl-CoA dioxygenase family protein [Novosphingobium sp.]
MTEAEIAEARTAYRRDGAAVIRGVLDGEWIERMRAAVDRVIAAPAASSVEYTPKGNSGRYVGDFFVWMRDPDFAALMLRSPLPALAGALMEARAVRFFYDQLLVKEPLTREETPWHQDLPYWPVRGEDILSLWVPLDPVTIETGAVQYARGSHREGQLYAPAAFSSDSGFAAIYAQLGLPPMPEEAAIRERHEVLAWETRPGDVVVHHPLTFHYSAGNLSPEIRRRAIATRYLGDDARWDARPGTFIQKESIRTGLIEPIALRDGDEVDSANFPLCWKRADV